jgi:hypothetical protein
MAIVSSVGLFFRPMRNFLKLINSVDEEDGVAGSQVIC